MSFENMILREDMLGIKLSGVSFKNARFQNAVLEKAKLRGSDFSHSEIVKSNFQWAVLTKGKERGPHIKQAGVKVSTNFNDSKITGTSFKYASLTGGTFKRARLTNVDFSYTVLTDVSFVDSEWFINSSLTYSDVRGADFTNAKGLNAAILKGALIDGKTKIPENLKASLRTCWAIENGGTDFEFRERILSKFGEAKGGAIVLMPGYACPPTPLAKP
jgi:uncharacterized protein YjbI with pentapeptide repeats